MRSYPIIHSFGIQTILGSVPAYVFTENDVESTFSTNTTQGVNVVILRISEKSEENITL